MAIISYLDYYRNGPSALEAGDSIAIKVVATLGYGDDWAAYKALSFYNDKEVAEKGDKLSQEAAEALFPSFKDMGLRYRR